MSLETFSPVFDGAALVGNSDNNKLTGTDLNDHLSGLAGKDQLRGLDGMDVLEGGLGKDKLLGGDGDDTLAGGEDKDKLFGGDGKDTLAGNEDKDKLFGGNDDDWLSGGGGRDLLHGDEGDDTLVGGEGKDTLRGGTGNDVIDGGAGDDSVYLGEGSDVVVLSASNGYDKIKDFKVGTDKIQLNNLTFGDLEMVTKGRNDTIVQIKRPGHFSDGKRIARFKGVRIAQLNVDDFIFANSGPTKPDDTSAIADDQTPEAKSPVPDSSEPILPQKPLDPGSKSDDSSTIDDGATNEAPIEVPNESPIKVPSEIPNDGTTLWNNSFSSPDWMDAWDVRSSKSWGFDNLEVIPDAQGNSGQILRVDYPKGSATPSVSRKEGSALGGAQFYADLDLPPQDELRLSYDVRFSENFDFVKGGKLPGLFGGAGASGGNIPDGTDGFSTRLMWRRDGDGEVYAYLPTSKGFGTSIDRGAWQFEPGDWYQVEQEVKLNHPDRSDGEIRVWVDDKLVIDQRDLKFRTVDSLKIDGVFFSTFFGGGDSSWATPYDVHADFANFAVSAAA